MVTIFLNVKCWVNYEKHTVYEIELDFNLVSFTLQLKNKFQSIVKRNKTDKKIHVHTKWGK